MNSARKNNSRRSAPSVSITLPATVGSVSQTQGSQRQKKKKNNASRSSVPLATSLRSVAGRPTFLQPSSSDGRIRVRHREYVSDVRGNGDGSFSVKSLSVNPALSGTFPWLSTLAQCFESYSFQALAFVFEPMVGATEPGVAMLALDFDAGDPMPGSKVQMMQTFGAARSSVWDCLSMPASRQNLSKLPQRFTRKTDPFTGVGDIKTYDVGNVLIATEGLQSTNVKGEIYVVYDIELITPQPVIVAPEPFSAKLVTYNSSASSPFADADIVQGAPIATPTSSDLIKILKAGEYLLDFAFATNNAGAGDGLVLRIPPGDESTLLTRIYSIVGDASHQYDTYRARFTKDNSTFSAKLEGPSNPVQSTLRISPYLYSNS